MHYFINTQLLGIVNMQDSSEGYIAFVVSELSAKSPTGTGTLSPASPWLPSSIIQAQRRPPDYGAAGHRQYCGQGDLDPVRSPDQTGAQLWHTDSRGGAGHPQPPPQAADRARGRSLNDVGPYGKRGERGRGHTSCWPWPTKLTSTTGQSYMATLLCCWPWIRTSCTGTVITTKLSTSNIRRSPKRKCRRGIILVIKCSFVILHNLQHYANTFPDYKTSDKRIRVVICHNLLISISKRW